MTRLLLDVGNTRVKYALDGGAPMAAVVHDGDPAAAVLALRGRLGDIDEVALVDVTGQAGPALDGLVVRQLVSTAAACGVTNGYADPTRLGADRWAALIGAWHRTPRACCVVDAGSALTVDLLDAEGRHLGGWIVPGLAMSAAALARGTARAHAAHEGRAIDGPADNTADAIRGGTVHAALGFIERTRRMAAAEFGGEAALILTGGDATLLAPGLPRAQQVDDLVLCGLAAWAAAP